MSRHFVSMTLFNDKDDPIDLERWFTVNKAGSLVWTTSPGEDNAILMVGFASVSDATPTGIIIQQPFRTAFRGDYNKIFKKTFFPY